MGANLSKFLLVGQIFQVTASPTPPSPIFPTTNETIIHKPEVEIDSDNEFEYDDPVFLSSFYAEENIVTIVSLHHMFPCSFSPNKSGPHKC